MLCEVAIFCKFDELPEEIFTHELSDWVDGGPVELYRKVDDLTQQKFEGIEQTRTVTTEGLQTPIHGYLNVTPPKYPPAKLYSYRCDHSIIAAVDAHAKLLVYSIDTVDPEDYDSLPAAMKDMKPDDPIKEEVWTPLEAGLIAITPVGEQQDQVTAALANWRSANPLGTAREFAVALRNFTS